MIADRIVRITLSHDELGELEIDEPDGFQGMRLHLERHKEFHSLVERFEGEFIFYGETATGENGGIDFIREAESTYGFDTDLRITIELSNNGGASFRTLFTGLLDLPNLEEMVDNKMMVPIIPDNIWTRFINRLDTPVDLSSTTTLDGDPCDPVTPVTVHLPNQKVRYNGHYTARDVVNYGNPVSDDQSFQIDFEDTIVDDFKAKKFTLPRVIHGNWDEFPSIAGIIEAPWNGEYTFDVRIETGNYITTDGLFDNPTDDPEIYIGISGGLNLSDYTELSRTVVNNGGNQMIIHEATVTFSLSKGQQITIFGTHEDNAGSLNIFGSRLPDWKNDCDLATTGSITLSGEQTIDGVLTSSSRVLVKNQNDQSQNGIYVTDAGAWARAIDATSNNELQDAKVLVTGGTVNAGLYFMQAYEDVDVGVSPIVWEAAFYDDTKEAPYPGTGTPDTHLIITADTIYPATTAQGYLLHDAFAGVVHRITGNPCFYSEFLGSTLTNERQYDSDGCAWMYAILKGLQVRGYTLAEKSFFSSFKQLWEGANPIFNLGVGFETLDNSPEIDAIRLEQKAHFYQEETSIEIDNVRQITRSYDEDNIFKTVKVGYRKWQAEDISGIDDPQTKKTYALPFKKTGKELVIESDFIAASLAIEVTRRQAIDKSKDYKFDNDTFIIAINEDDLSPDAYTPELDENFQSVTNLLNSETRYNLLLTPMRNFFRWANVVGGCMERFYTDQSYKFVSGEGNYDMVSDFICGENQCRGIICDNMAENQDIPLGSPSFFSIPFGYLHLPDMFDKEIPLELEDYDTIRNSPKNAIGISQTETGHIAFFIKDLSFNPIRGMASLKDWARDAFSMEVIPTDPYDKPCP